MSANQMLNDFLETLRSEIYLVPERLYGPFILNEMIVPANEVIIQNKSDWIPDLRGFSIGTDSIRYEPTSEDKALNLRGMMDEWAEEQEDAAIDLHGDGHYYQVTEALRNKELIQDHDKSNSHNVRDVMMDQKEKDKKLERMANSGFSYSWGENLNLIFFDGLLGTGSLFPFSNEKEPELDIPEYTI